MCYLRGAGSTSEGIVIGREKARTVGDLSVLK